MTAGANGRPLGMASLMEVGAMNPIRVHSRLICSRSHVRLSCAAMKNVHIFLLCCFLFIASAGFAQNARYDVVIRNAPIVDGTGNPWYRAAIAIQDDRLPAIANTRNVPPPP